MYEQAILNLFINISSIPKCSYRSIQVKLLIKVTGMFSLLPTKHPIRLISHTIDFIFKFFNSSTSLFNTSSQEYINSISLLSCFYLSISKLFPLFIRPISVTKSLQITLDLYFDIYILAKSFCFLPQAIQISYSVFFNIFSIKLNHLESYIQIHVIIYIVLYTLYHL